MPLTRIIDDQKIKKTIELVVYIASKLNDKPNYGSTLLGKALYFIDSVNYLKTGKPITELTYIKQEKGPTPNPNKFLSIRDALVANGDLEKIEMDYFGRTQQKFIAKREPNINVFTKEEIFLIDGVLESICDHNATEISELSHLFLAWNIAENKEELPFHSFLLDIEDPTDKDLEWANKEIKLFKKSGKKYSSG